MNWKLTYFCFVIFVLALLSSQRSIAQDLNSANHEIETFLEIEASGTFAPTGRPIEPPIRVAAGNSCIIDLKQAYDIFGTLSGSLEIDYRIIVYGPCEVPPVPGKYHEKWIAHGTFTGEINGSKTTGNYYYTAQVEAGGDVKGNIVFGDRINGELEVWGHFADEKLSYRGRTKFTKEQN